MACAVVTHACDLGTKPDETYCRNIINTEACNTKKDIPCISDIGSNTADCFLYGGTVCKAKNIACQQGFTESCTGRTRTECVETGAQCKEAQSNTTDCAWYPPSNSCQPTNINCRSGYRPACGTRSVIDCETTGVSCISYDPGPSTPLSSYNPKCYGRFGEGVKSGLGCIPTDPQAFINTATPWAIGIGSGIAFLLGLYGALMIVISAGDPEKMQAGKEIITSAIAGLLLIVFAVFILRIIGVDVLKLF